MTEEIVLEHEERVPERVVKKVRTVKAKSGMDIPWRDITLILVGLVAGLMIG